MLCRVYRYGEEYRVVWFKRALSAEDFGNIDRDVESVESSPNDCKLDNNICRARSRITEIALCNTWEYFVTLTLNKDKQDRYDIDGYVRDLGVWIGNYNRKFGVKLKYLLIPERHKDGAVHMHGLFHDCAADSLCRNEHGYLNLPYYASRFGYISLSPVRDSHKVARYITKYVSKDIGQRVQEVGKHLFYSSHGLNGREQIAQTLTASTPTTCSGIFENEWCMITTCSSEREALAAAGLGV